MGTPLYRRDKGCTHTVFVGAGLTLLAILAVVVLVGSRPIQWSHWRTAELPVPPVEWQAHDAIARQENAPRLPPDQLTQWVSYARARNCSCDDGDYDQIFQQLLPFRRSGGISSALVQRAFDRLEPQRLLVTIRGGAYRMLGDWSDIGVAGYMQQVIPELAPLLPDLSFVLNLNDEPRSWVAPLPPDTQAQLAGGAISQYEAWRRHACDSAGLRQMKEQHGLLAAPTMFRGVHGLLPVFSAYTVPGCFADILVPRKWDSTSSAENATLHSGCPLSHDWKRKKPVAVFRGTPTGAHYNDSALKGTWRRYHRQRLVAYSRAHPHHLDAAFTDTAQCEPAACRALEAQYAMAPHLDASQTAAYKYQMVVDGNGAADRLAPALCSGSLVLMANMLVQWFDFRLQPRQHYLPVRLDYSDLAAQVDWARQHDDEAARIAARASELVNSKLRAADARCYLYRLLLEYAAIYQPPPPAPPTPPQPPAPPPAPPGRQRMARVATLAGGGWV